ncbi:poly(A) polymerase PAP, putative [Babesia caballi]|uniref:Poly(A) polymerase n=1 Tax=Babesia caballi TaxID=5871 RepID=A0AAV4LQ04_BABCB|nr:poly(A) polymerase PAP, putative [Babesia caballi]
MADAVLGGQEERYGITDPVSTDGPTEGDREATAELMSLLRAQNLFETEEGKLKRERVLEALNRVLQKFVRVNAARQLGITEEEASKISAKLLTFGSYRLGIVAPDSDIDCLCLCPQSVTREAFFGDFYNALKQLEPITKLHAVPDAYTPVIKLIYDGVDIDLLFANLPAPSVPEAIDVLDDSILRNMNEATARSINGCRVAALILSLVPNKDNFRTALRYVKLWANRRGLYTTVMGYMGGVAWAILTARICQLYPNFLPNQLVQKFFRVYAQWNWRYPVMLCKIKAVPNLPGYMAFKVWDPRSNPTDRQHLMPVITPAFPSMNSTHNITVTTKRILTEEFKRAHELLKVSRKAADLRRVWEQVLEKEDMFASHNHFLVIEVLASTEHVHGKWEGWIGSRMRFLIKKIEVVPNILVRPWPEFFKYKHVEWEYASCVFFGFRCKPPEKGAASASGEPAARTFDMRMPIKGFKEIINGWTEMETYKDQIAVNIRYLKNSQLPSFVNPRHKRAIDEVA